MMTTREILKAAATLPDSERVELIEALLASFDPPSCEPADAATAWREIASERAAELDRGAPTVPWDEVRRESERRIHDRSSD